MTGDKSKAAKQPRKPAPAATAKVQSRHGSSRSRVTVGKKQSPAKPDSPQNKRELRRPKAPPKRSTSENGEASTGPKSGPWIRTSKDRSFDLKVGRSVLGLFPSVTVMGLSVKWNHIVQERSRWKGNNYAQQQHQRHALKDLFELGITEENLAEIADDRLVEVNSSIPSEVVKLATGSLLPVPWEYLLSVATKEFRGERDLSVFRYLPSRKKNRSKSFKPTTHKVLHLHGAQTRPAVAAKLRAESRFLERGLKSPQGVEVDLQIMRAPTVKELLIKIREFRPNIIHVSGIAGENMGQKGTDHLTARKSPTSEEKTESWVTGTLLDRFYADGLLLRNEEGPPVVVPPKELASIITDKGEHCPDLVSFNVNNSGGRICPLVVENGARVAIGIQDTIDQITSEMFFGYFYTLLGTSEFAVHKSFHLAWEQVKEEVGSLEGTGIVFWSDKSLATLEEEDLNELRRNSTLYRHPLLNELDTINHREIDLKENDIRDVVSVDIDLPDDLYYALLHNGEDLFRTFLIRKHEPGRIRDIGIEVVLYVGAERFPYRASVNLESRVLDVNQQIRIPLAWNFVRSIRESVRTTIQIKVDIGGTVLYNNTHPINLLPVDTWSDDEKYGDWLPSFVQPRDPAVAEIVKRAECYLKALVDSNRAAFDGYQSFTPGAEDPCEGIDLQVRALWAALVHEMEISYINPPPSYSAGSQRLRSPTEVVEGLSGTCIDLSLMLAACLEYVDIYPVIILCKGHAFVGYWRSHDAHASFVSMSDLLTSYSESSELVRERGDSETEGSADGDSIVERMLSLSSMFDTLIPRDIRLDSQLEASIKRRAWVSGREAYPEIVNMVLREDLVPIETIALTEHKGFWEAVDDGRDNLQRLEDFETLLDIRLARDKGVTPLPLRGGPQ